jgi:DNA polymerase III subunit beta
MSTEETRYNLNGIYLHADEESPNVLRATATDCHRLSTSSTPIKNDISPFGVILPSKAVQEILKILKTQQISDKKVEMFIEQNRLRFQCHNIILKSKIIDGTFPEYKAFIPEGNEYKLVIEAKILAEVIDRVSTIIVDKFKAITISCNTNQVEMHASGTSGNAQEILTNHSCGSLSYSGPDVKIGFNPKYILDALHAVSDSVVTIELQDSTSPVLIKADKHPYAQFIVMPVNI